MFILWIGLERGEGLISTELRSSKGNKLTE
jgi:hypothetical protein